MVCVSYQECLNSIFETYMRVKHLLKGRYDREIRRPWVVLGVARDLGLLPDPHKTVRVTGSKGKGTTSRLIAQGIELAFPNATVGLLVSPEELEHTDRMRVNGVCISEQEFVSCYNEIFPALKSREENFSSLEYFSPSGLFLLVALFWFKKRGVTHYVLEGGRGVLFDEVGNINSKVSVVCSIFSEHLNCLGPTERDVAIDKLSVGKSSDVVLLGPSALRWNTILNAVPQPCFETVLALGQDQNLPSWVEINRALAARAIECLLEARFAPESLCLRASSFPSFGTFHVGAVKGFYECLISRESLDAEFFAAFAKHRSGRCAAVVSLPDDKDLEGIVNKLQSGFGVPVFHVPLLGTRGYLEYKRTLSEYSDNVIASVEFNNARAFSQVFLSFCDARGFSEVAVLGTQSYIRLFRNMISELKSSD
jgi:folylpolyglutamate synthase/dihydropteroate synthase